jgi:hypothetical protein
MDHSEPVIFEQIAFLLIVIIFSMPDCYIYPSHLCDSFDKEQKGGLYQLPPSFIKGKGESNSLATRYKSPFYLPIFLQNTTFLLTLL